MAVFRDRDDAGRKLGEACKAVFRDANLVYAIPRGGVAVGYHVARALGLDLDLVICRKLLIPWNREAGFGAVSPEGDVFVDKVYAYSIGLTNEDIEKAVSEQLEEIKNRNAKLRGNRPYPLLTGKRVVLVDDGIAAGYTMEASIRFLRAKKASRVYIAVPTGCMDSVVRIAKRADKILCLNIRSGPWFAVADAYEEWRDLTDEDVLSYLKRSYS